LARRKRGEKKQDGKTGLARNNNGGERKGNMTQQRFRKKKEKHKKGLSRINR
jgi:hypothetical protein